MGDFKKKKLMLTYTEMMMKKKKILLLSIICAVVIILVLIALDFSIMKYKEATWRDKIKLGMNEQEVYAILPIKNGGCNLAHGTHRSGHFELSDGTKLSLVFYIPHKEIMKNMLKHADKNGEVDINVIYNMELKYILKSYRIKEEERVSK